MTDSRVIAECSDYLGLIAAMRARIAELGIGVQSDNAAEISGLAPGHLAKLLTPLKSGKHLTMMTLGPVLGLLALKIVLVEDLDALRKVNRRLEKRNGSYVRDNATHFAISKQKLREMGQKGGKIRKERMSANALRKSARHAALARHSNGIAAKRSESARHAALMRWSPSYRAAVEDGGRQVSSLAPA